MRIKSHQTAFAAAVDCQGLKISAFGNAGRAQQPLLDFRLWHKT
jgi:hypothetical protein